MNEKPDLTRLPESTVCSLASRALQELIGEEAPAPQDLRLNYRVGLEQGTLLTLDFEPPTAEGEGLGGFSDEWTTTIVLNLVSIFLWEGMKLGYTSLRKPEVQSQIKTQVYHAAGRCSALVERTVDAVLEQVRQFLDNHDS